jgi:hypothetical protein
VVPNSADDLDAAAAAAAATVVDDCFVIAMRLPLDAEALNAAAAAAATVVDDCFVIAMRLPLDAAALKGNITVRCRSGTRQLLWKRSWGKKEKK